MGGLRVTKAKSQPNLSPLYRFTLLSELFLLFLYFQLWYIVGVVNRGRSKETVWVDNSFHSEHELYVYYCDYYTSSTFKCLLYNLKLTTINMHYNASSFPLPLNNTKPLPADSALITTKITKYNFLLLILSW